MKLSEICEAQIGFSGKSSDQKNRIKIKEYKTSKNWGRKTSSHLGNKFQNNFKIFDYVKNNTLMVALRNFRTHSDRL